MLRSEDIKAVRERLGESQAKFARHFGVDQSTIHRWETRGFSDDTLRDRSTQVMVEKLLADLKAKKRDRKCA